MWDMLGFGRQKQEVREFNIREVLRKCRQQAWQHHWPDSRWAAVDLPQDLIRWWLLSVARRLLPPLAPAAGHLIEVNRKNSHPVLSPTGHSRDLTSTKTRPVK